VGWTRISAEEELNEVKPIKGFWRDYSRVYEVLQIGNAARPDRPRDSHCHLPLIGDVIGSRG